MMKNLRSICILSAFLLLSCSRIDVQAPTGEFTFSLTSFNVLGVESKAEWKPRVAAVAAIINREDHRPDVLCLQECASPAIQADLVALFGDTYDYHLLTLTDASPALIFWKRDRFEKADAGFSDMLLGDSGYGLSDYPASRFAHYVQLKEKSTGCEFLVYDIHLKTNSSTVSYQKLRNDCITALCSAADARSRGLGGIPVFIAGDFNNYLYTEEQGLVSAPSACMGAGYTDAASNAAELINLNYKTSGVDLGGTATPRPDGSSRIDYIFYRGDSVDEVLRYWTVIDFVPGSDTSITTPVASDHHPVNAIFKMRYK